MKRRILSLLLSLILIVSLGSSAFAASSPTETGSSAIDRQLAAVTLLVKETLGIGDEYSAFYGNLNDKVIRKVWYLNWSNDNEYLTVYADDDGKILYYSRSVTDYSSRYEYNFAPKFPSVTREQARAVAEAFLARVLEKNESCELGDGPKITDPTDVDRYYFDSVLKLNGLDSPINITVSVSTADLKVSYFNRADLSTDYIGSLPTPDPVTAKAKAAELLAGTIKMNIRYVLADDTNSESPRAILRYLPISTGSYVVNAKTGELIDINRIYDEINRGLRGDDSYAVGETAASADKATLSAAETEGIAKLEGVFTQEQLDSKARAISELGISGEYTLGTVRYTLNNETNEVTAILYYSLRIKPDPGNGDRSAIEAASGEYVTFINKTLSLDAKTGELISLYTSYPYDERYTTLKRDRVALRAKAEGFLGKYYSEEYGKTALYEEASDVSIYDYYRSYSPSESYIYSQNENGYFFPVNHLNISVNAETGYIDSFSRYWTDNVSFESPDGIISNEEACAKYADAYETKLSYVSLPSAIDPTRSDMVPYMELGYTYLHELILGYTHYSDKNIYAVDAKTGNVVSYGPYVEAGIPEYSDISGHYAEAKLRKLAQYGIGFPGAAFRPDAKLTQLDMVILLMSADGYRFDSENLTESQIDQLYSSAIYRNIIRKEDKDPAKPMTRRDMIRTILTMSGYDKTADLKGIYICRFNDASSIREADYGYFAIAQGLGVINGDDKGNVNPYAGVTRVEAALMLYNFMSR